MIGIRIALGAKTGDVMRMALGQASRIARTGLLIGVPAAYLFMQLLSNVLVNLVDVKWTTFSAVTVLLALPALLAAYIPGRRAGRRRSRHRAT